MIFVLIHLFKNQNQKIIYCTVWKKKYMQFMNINFNQSGSSVQRNLEKQAYKDQAPINSTFEFIMLNRET